MVYLQEHLRYYEPTVRRCSSFHVYPITSVSLLYLRLRPFYKMQAFLTGEQGVETAKMKHSIHARTSGLAASWFADGRGGNVDVE